MERNKTGSSLAGLLELPNDRVLARTYGARVLSSLLGFTMNGSQERHRGVRRIVHTSSCASQNNQPMWPCGSTWQIFLLLLPSPSLSIPLICSTASLSSQLSLNGQHQDYLTCHRMSFRLSSLSLLLDILCTSTTQPRTASRLPVISADLYRSPAKTSHIPIGYKAFSFSHTEVGIAIVVSACTWEFRA